MAALPSAVFRNGCWLNGKIDQVAYHDGTFEAVLSLEGFADYFERHHQFVPDLRNAFDVLWWCSSMLFLPLLHEQVATGTSVYKRTCLAGKFAAFSAGNARDPGAGFRNQVKTGAMDQRTEATVRCDR